MGFREVGDGAHHGQGAHGHDLGYGFASDDVLQGVRDQALPAQGAVIGGDDQFGGSRTQLIGQQHALLAAAAQDGDDAPALGMELLGRRKDGRAAITARHQHDGSFFHQFGRRSHGPGHGE